MALKKMVAEQNVWGNVMRHGVLKDVSANKALHMEKASICSCKEDGYQGERGEGYQTEHYLGPRTTMAKSSRASSRKANNQRLKANVFGPVEIARNARLSAKLLELAAAPKPERADSESMNIVEDVDANNSGNAEKEGAIAADETAMDVDAAKAASTSTKSSSKKGRIEKRRKTSKIVFPKYGDKTKKKRKH
ncbi:hypothetical protein CIB48_g9708 [Xylaria polymorpha]|nr:hypothetical protein CIB48_g9708 [Xylaria polymorpha]